MNFYKFVIRQIVKQKKQIDILNKEIRRMHTENAMLKEDVAELSNGKLNISEINSIIDPGLIEVGTIFESIK